MTWYAIRTVPGSQKPKREYVVEPTSSLGKGYRIVPSLDPHISAVEKALGDAGFTYYMPAEKRLIRDRRHTDLWKVRRFALMVGYMFVRGPINEERLRSTPGVIDLVRSGDGRPLPILLDDILMVRAAEAATEVEFDTASRKARKLVRKRAKKDPRLAMLVQRLDIAGTISFPLDSEVVAA